MRAFAQAFDTGTCNLEHLNLSDCEAGDAAAVALAEVLVASSPIGDGSMRLKRLDLSYNCFTVKGKHQCRYTSVDIYVWTCKCGFTSVDIYVCTCKCGFTSVNIITVL